MKTPTPDISSYWKSHDICAGYIPFKHCISYVKQKSGSIPYGGKMQDIRLKIMKSVGMSNYNKFQRRRMKWDELESTIPLNYFHEIGVDLEVLEYCLGLDNDEYKSVLRFERKVTHAFGKILGGIFSTIPLPSNVADEANAIEFLNDEMLNKRLRYSVVSIFFNNIIRHTFKRGEGHVSTQHYYPSLLIKNNFLTKQTCDESKGFIWL